MARTPDPALPAATAKPSVARALVRWYRRGHRDLPWRQTRDPYAIWLSEIMLQQTQVATVIPYFERFMAAYPDVASLAAAPLDGVLKRWEGLGYYARCRNLHKAAQLVCAEHGGRFPKTRVGLEALPGVGRSTAGSIASFAFGAREALLDGNAKRVLVRLWNLQAEVTRPATLRWLWGRAESLLPKGSTVRDYNQALMELGAVLCTPRDPACPSCPLRRHCDARAAGTQASLPRKKRRAPTPHYTIGAGVIFKRGRVLIQRRPPEGLLGGLWEFPGGKQEGSEAITTTVVREIDEELGLEVTVRPGAPIAVIDHAYSHFKITLHAYRCDYVAGEPLPRAATAVRWVWPGQLTRYAFPRANQKVLERLLAEKR